MPYLIDIPASRTTLPHVPLRGGGEFLEHGLCEGVEGLQGVDFEVREPGEAGERVVVHGGGLVR